MCFRVALVLFLSSCVTSLPLTPDQPTKPEVLIDDRQPVLVGTAPIVTIIPETTTMPPIIVDPRAVLTTTPQAPVSIPGALIVPVSAIIAPSTPFPITTAEIVTLPPATVTPGSPDTTTGLLTSTDSSTAPTTPILPTESSVVAAAADLTSEIFTDISDPTDPAGNTTILGAIGANALSAVNVLLNLGSAFGNNSSVQGNQVVNIAGNLNGVTVQNKGQKLTTPKESFEQSEASALVNDVTPTNPASTANASATGASSSSKTSSGPGFASATAQASTVSSPAPPAEPVETFVGISMPLK